MTANLKEAVELCGQRRIIRSCVKINGHHYGSSLLTDDNTVFVRLDLSNRGRAHVYSADQTAYIGEALCPELCGKAGAA